MGGYPRFIAGLNPFRHVATAMLICFLAFSNAIAADTYPDRAIKIIVPNTTGSSVDTLARQLAVPASELIKQSIYIDNKPGAGGLIGSQLLARSDPDGYSLAVIGSTYVIVPHLHSKLNFDPLKDVDPVAMLGILPLVLVVPANSRFNDVEALLEKARHVDRGLTIGAPGIGTALHLAAIQFQQQSDTRFLEVQYKGVAPLLVDVMGGTVDAAFLTVGSAVKLIEDGKLKALAVSSATDLLPGVVPLDEAGVKGYDFEAWVAVFAPRGLEAAVMERWSGVIDSALRQEAFRQVLNANGMVIKFMGPDAAREFIEHDYVRSGELVRQAGVEPQ
ncbi:tripartite tricarboxylate transporter substrate binding protein [Alcaligenaceae bacterium]|nr:tripartite tricarboxylate transporter substrate binding protein [Alcaligenaceae bacterium]